MKYSRNRNTTSPYAKYAKRPYVYSAYYRAWQADKDSDGLYAESTMDRDEAFRKYHGLPPRLSRSQSFDYSDAA